MIEAKPEVWIAVDAPGRLVDNKLLQIVRLESGLFDRTYSKSALPHDPPNPGLLLLVEADDVQMN